MARPLTQIVVFHIILYLLLQVNASPYSVQDFKSLFANPVKDFIKLFQQVGTRSESHKRDWKNKTDYKIDEKMIEVPPNTNNNKCEYGTAKDVNGVCRTPF